MSERNSPRISPAGFAVAALAVGLGTAVGLATVPVAGSYVGMLAGGFLVGLGLERRPLVESGLAAGLASLGILAAGGAIGSGVGAAVSALGSVPPAQLLTSVLLGGAVGAFGAHFGDDLRDGLTTPVESQPSGSTAGSGGIPATGSETRARERADATSSTRDGADGSEAEGPAEDTLREGDETAEAELELERE